MDTPFPDWPVHRMHPKILQDKEMEKIRIEPSQIAQEAVISANTGSYVFRRLLDDPFVRYISATTTTQEIIEWFAAQPKLPTDAKDAVVRYMYLVALSWKLPEESVRAVRTISLDGLEFGQEIARLIESKAIPTSQIIIKASCSHTAERIRQSSSAGKINLLSDPTKLKIRSYS